MAPNRHFECPDGAPAKELAAFNAHSPGGGGRPHVRFLPGVILGREVKARALPWTRQGHSPWNQPVGDNTIGLNSHPTMALVSTRKG
jgi:hypothetical protein